MVLFYPVRAWLDSVRKSRAGSDVRCSLMKRSYGNLSAVMAFRPSVSGSVLNGTDPDDSDLDLLVDPGEPLLTIAGLKIEAEKLLGVPVSVLTPNGFFAIRCCNRPALYEASRPPSRLPGAYCRSYRTGDQLS